MAVPHRRAADVDGGLVAGHVAHLLDADHGGEAIAPSLDLGARRERGDAARGAGRLVPRGRDAGQCRIARREEAAEMPLAAEQLGREVADVRNLDVLRLELHGIEPGGHGVAERVEEFAAVALPVLGEVALPAAEDVDVASHGPCYYGSVAQATRRRGRCGDTPGLRTGASGCAWAAAGASGASRRRP
ncbi:MAG: hypothetical protein U1F11_08515 [Steroidobacteraceae bacterium]